MSRSVSFSLPPDLFEMLDFAAAAKGMSRSEYARGATIAHMQKYPAKGVIADLVASRGVDPKNMTAGGNCEEVSDDKYSRDDA